MTETRFDRTSALIPSDAHERQIAVGATADQFARAGVFADYQARAPNTLRRQLADLTTFADYLTAVKFYAAADGQAEQLYSNPAAWAHITYGVIVAFREWMLQQGYAVGTVDLKLSTVRQYAKLAFQAGALDAGQHALIRTVSGYQFKEQKRVDEKRSADGRTTRKGAKKANP